GVALAHAIGGTSAPRPLTHDLFAETLERYGIDVVAVRLTGRTGATYFAELVLVGPVGRSVLSCRPSDGICLALRQRVPAPVLCDERLFSPGVDVPPDDSAGDDPAQDGAG
ncbi:MAG: bifunctional nuclease family protein, partial [Acidimicrobiales bacterium]